MLRKKKRKKLRRLRKFQKIKCKACKTVFFVSKSGILRHFHCPECHRIRGFTILRDKYSPKVPVFVLKCDSCSWEWSDIRIVDVCPQCGNSEDIWYTADGLSWEKVAGIQVRTCYGG